MMKKKIVIYGAGAIGRGYLPWVFSPQDYEFYFVEANEVLRDMLKLRGVYNSYVIRASEYQKREVSIAGVYAPGEEFNWHIKPDFIVTAVGPRNVLGLSYALRHLSETRKIPILCFENDSHVAESLRVSTGNPNVFFGVPDVITSNTAPDWLLKEDPLAIVTEDGICYLDKEAQSVGGEIHFLGSEELNEQWLAKLYIHNTTHCIAAYLGAHLGLSYLHESMDRPVIDSVVLGAMSEVQTMLQKKFKLSESFVNAYGKKELSRFRNKLLFDPIPRVAREPFRKLLPNERLVGAAQLCLSAGVIPVNIMLGIMAAFKYVRLGDPDYHISYLVRALNPQDFLRIIIGLRKGEALNELLLENWASNIAFIGKLS
jgi:mannitol-1-phosphate 5-dehydrogenase